MELKLKICPGDKFNIVASVLIKNPKQKPFKGAIKGGDPLSPVSEVIEALLSGMYSYQKGVFEDEIGLFKRKEKI